MNKERDDAIKSLERIKTLSYILDKIQGMESECACGCDFKDGCLCKQVREGFNKCRSEVEKVIEEMMK